MLEEILQIKKILLRFVTIFVSALLFFFFVGTSLQSFGSFSCKCLSFAGDSFAVMTLKQMESALLPPNVTLVAMSPMSALNAQVIVAALLALFVTIPYLIYAFVSFVTPALDRRERLVFFFAIIPIVLLFGAGMLFAYSYIIPPSFKFLFGYASAVNVSPFFSIEDFVADVFLFSVVTGVFFLMPVFMVFLSFVGAVSASFWARYWRYAQFGFLAFSAILTPDGSGVSMMIMALPLMVLYGAGWLVSRLVT